MSVRRHRRHPLLVSAVLVVGAGLALTACGPDDSSTGGTTAAAPPAASAAPSKGATTSGGTAPTGAPGASARSSAPAAHTPSSTGPSGAAAQPCDTQNLTVQVSARAGAARQRVIEVHNTGPAACTLSAYPRVDLGNATAADQSHNVKPLVPGGVGPYSLQAGHSAYAVLDLDPSGATSGTAPGIDEVDVLADGDHMPNADTHNFPIDAGTPILKPKLGDYRSSVAEAVTSMTGADKQL
ncbi:DUF4232 domain-containing protein [Kitasatospora sp. LaBMicrA B282]|uniref:DUF4232 domain-containing protein n=1 Tax=Kitasatospora sp. LaBMicrA B282 TaxID=3420949 RepID=UPI003D1395D7